MVACSISFVAFASTLLFVVVRRLCGTPGIRRLENKHVLITGGSSGIGRSTAIEASKLGANVTILARDEKKLSEVAEEARKAARCPERQKIRFLSLDVTAGSTAVGEAVRSAEATAGPVFVLVNCVGAAEYGEFDGATEADFRRMMEVNYFGTVFPTLSVARGMKTRKEGHIVVTGCQTSLLGIYGSSAYSASKFALRGFAESLHMELKPHDVSVTLCLPPDTDTPGFAAEQKTKPAATRALSRPGESFSPDDVARRLLSDALGRKFFSSVGLEGLVLTTLCAGMSPVGSASDALLQVSSMSLLRLVSIFYRLRFQRLVRGANVPKKNS